MTPTSPRKKDHVIFWLVFFHVAPFIVLVTMDNVMRYYTGRTHDPEMVAMMRALRLEDYQATCGAVPYPSTVCPAFYVGTMGNTWFDTPDRTEDWRDEHPCYAGQIKANQRSGIYHSPDGQWYVETRGTVLCFDTAVEAQASGYRASVR